MKVKVLLIIFASFSVFSKDLFNKYADETYRKYQNTITLQLIHSPYGINWNAKPYNVILDLARNKYLFADTKRALGHVTVELNCQSDINENIRVITGQGVKELGKLSKELLTGGIGLSLLNRPSQYKELPQITTGGILEDADILIPEFNYYLKEKSFFNPEHINKMAFLTYKITKSQCHSMLNFYSKYKEVTERTKNSEHPQAGNIYGFGAEPTRFEGAGCASYAEAFFDIVNLKEHFSFYQTIYATEKLIGDPKKNRKISLINLLTSKEDIRSNNKDKLKFEFPDPDLMHDLVQRINRNPEKFNNIVEKGYFGNKSRFAILDLTLFQ